MKKQQTNLPTESNNNTVTDFVKLTLDKTFSGKIVSFGKNNYGIYIVTDAGIISFQSIVLNNILKANVKNYFNVGDTLEVTKHNKPAGKKYFPYTVKINGEEISSRLESDNLNDLF